MTCKDCIHYTLCENRERIEKLNLEKPLPKEMQDEFSPMGCFSFRQRPIRCKDCKYYHHYGRTSLLVDGKNIKSGWCQRRMRYYEEHRMLPTDFCSYGERK